MEYITIALVSVVVGACAALVAHYLDSIAESNRRLVESMEDMRRALSSCAEELYRANQLTINPPFVMQPEPPAPERRPAEVSYISEEEAAQRDEEAEELDRRINGSRKDDEDE